MSDAADGSYSGGPSGGPLRRGLSKVKVGPYGTKFRSIRMTRTAAENLGIVEGPQSLITLSRNIMKSPDAWLAMIAALRRVFNIVSARDVVVAIDVEGKIFTKCSSALDAGLLTKLVLITDNPIASFNFARVDAVEFFHQDPAHSMSIQVLPSPAEDTLHPAAHVCPAPVMISKFVAENLGVEPGKQNSLVIVDGSMEAPDLWITITEACRRILSTCSEIKVAIDHGPKPFVKCMSEQAANLLSSYHAKVDRKFTFMFKKVDLLVFPTPEADAGLQIFVENPTNLFQLHREQAAQAQQAAQAEQAEDSDSATSSSSSSDESGRSQQQ